MARQNFWKNRFKPLLKIIGSAVFVYIILRQVSWPEILEVLSKTDLAFLVLCFLLSPVMILVSVWKWHVLLRAQGISVPFLRLFTLYYMGYLFQNLLPTNVGGDIVVAYKLAKYTGKPFDSVASIFMNRFTGMLVLIPFAVLSLVWYADSSVNVAMGFTLGIAVMASCGLIWMMWDSRLPKLVERLLRSRRTTTKVAGQFEKMRHALEVYRHEPVLLVFSLLISILFFLLMVVNVYVGCLAFSVNPSFIHLFLIIPFIQIVSMLPVSLGGIGLKEWAYMVAFPQIGVASSVGLSVSLLLRLKGIITGLIGAIFYPLLEAREGSEYARVNP